MFRKGPLLFIRAGKTVSISRQDLHVFTQRVLDALNSENPEATIINMIDNEYIKKGPYHASAMLEWISERKEVIKHPKALVVGEAIAKSKMNDTNKAPQDVKRDQKEVARQKSHFIEAVTDKHKDAYRGITHAVDKMYHKMYREHRDDTQGLKTKKDIEAKHKAVAGNNIARSMNHMLQDANTIAGIYVSYDAKLGKLVLEASNNAVITQEMQMLRQAGNMVDAAKIVKRIRGLENGISPEVKAVFKAQEVQMQTQLDSLNKSLDECAKNAADKAMNPQTAKDRHKKLAIKICAGVAGVVAGVALIATGIAGLAAGAIGVAVYGAMFATGVVTGITAPHVAALGFLSKIRPDKEHSAALLDSTIKSCEGLVNSMKELETKSREEKATLGKHTTKLSSKTELATKLPDPSPMISVVTNVNKELHTIAGKMERGEPVTPASKNDPEIQRVVTETLSLQKDLTEAATRAIRASVMLSHKAQAAEQGAVVAK